MYLFIWVRLTTGVVVTDSGGGGQGHLPALSAGCFLFSSASSLGLSQRSRIGRLLAYFSGAHGAAVFVENGEVRGRPGETGRRGVGVLWLDTASAAVPRSATSFRPAVGPGVHFLSWGEYIHQAVDLHTLTSTLGPGNQDDPFGIKADHPDYEAVMERRRETSALTRDGIEVVVEIGLDFGISSSDESKSSQLTPFGFSPENVEKYVTRNVSREVVGKMVVDIWRDYIRRIRLDQLFETPEGSERARHQVIAQMVNDRLSKPVVDYLDEYGRLLQGRQVDSMEYKQVQEMGIGVKASMRRLFFAPEVEEQLLTEWTTNWRKNAERERDQVEQVRGQRGQLGLHKAVKQFAANASQDMGIDPANKAKAVELLTHATLHGILRDAALQRHLTTERNSLSDIIAWMREHETD
jgi:hypothetical protein